ncbi:NitT/TauT family transport system permease protein [Ruminococcaceae bacterium YRB3002]|nr:NitT/TauT family transport system permease protein [Ruminococcaceae bacterium YRB3002]
MKTDKKLRTAIIILIWLALWQAMSLLIHNAILFAGPYETGKALFTLASTGAFWLSLGNTALRIISGFVIGAVLGMVMAYIAYKHRLFGDFIAPFISVIKSIPVASFVILLLIWFGAPCLSLIISALVVFPMIYLNTYEGLVSTDIKLLEMARIFRMSNSSIIKNIYLPHLKPFLAGAFKLASGMSWKSGIAAEVIARPVHSMGDSIYQSKIYIDTAELFAWTLMAILLAFLFEKAITLAVRRIFR